eukprot:m.300567 g.300567  ORF g.300567 m.300567 type:complete len:281 (-) comp55212_c2_seq3:1872-2714(-)
MADYTEQIPNEDKIRIASDFVLHAPPGEFNEVFNDVRVLLGDDQLLKEGAAPAFRRYNEEQFTPCKLDGAATEVLITKHAAQEDGTYLDPRSKQTFTFDHLRKVATNPQPAAIDEDAEPFRAALDTATQEYSEAHYPAGISAVYAKGNDFVICIEDHKFNPDNFWNGRWRSEWTVNKTTGEAKGVLKVQVHYYEEGNVQLVSQKKIELKVAVGDAAATAKALLRDINKAESEYQTAIAENYNTMSETTFKALRRSLPVTRTKVDWNKILNYKLGKELANK